jgi:hypothetical protein
VRRMMAVVAATVLGLAGCDVPAGTDGNLVDDWPGLPEPKLWVPHAHSCYQAEGLGTRDGVVPCAEPHLTETVHVDAFTGAAAAATAPPRWYEEASRAAHQACDTAAQDFLGDHWQAGRVLLTVSIPAQDTWTAGGRWFRCDLRELDERTATSPTGAESVPRLGSLRDGLRGERPLARGCYSTGRAVSCSTPHDAEFAGLFRTTAAAYADEPKTQQKARDGCLGVVARFVGIPRNQYQKYADWTVGTAYNEESSHPIRAFRCLVRTKRPVSRSLKGAGPAAIP